MLPITIENIQEHLSTAYYDYVMVTSLSFYAIIFVFLLGDIIVHYFISAEYSNSLLEEKSC